MAVDAADGAYEQPFMDMLRSYKGSAEHSLEIYMKIYSGHFSINILLIPLAAGAYVHFMKDWSIDPMWVQQL